LLQLKNNFAKYREMQNENKLVISMGFGVFWAVLASTTVYAADSIEGYWKSIDDRTGEPLSIIEFKKKIDGTYSGTIVHRYPNVSGVILTHCVKCAAPNTNKPILGMEIVSGVTKDPKTQTNIIMRLC
jgi:hypothetical protein